MHILYVLEACAMARSSCYSLKFFINGYANLVSLVFECVKTFMPVW